MILEQILRITGVYKNLCDEYEFLEIIFKKAKTGKIDDLFRDDNVRNTAFRIIEDITGVPEKYLSGEERIKLNIELEKRYKANNDLKSDDKSIDTIDLKNDDPFFDKVEGDGHAYHGKFYQELLKNPIHLEYDEIYKRVFGKVLSDSEYEKTYKVIESLYSIRGLLTVIIINMADKIEIIDKAIIYKHSEWEPYITNLSKSTESNITYKPKFIEIKEGLVQIIMKNIYDLGIVFTFRDTNKKFIF